MAFDPINNHTIRTLRFALDGLQRRQTAIANNLANLETPGYQAVDVSFEDTLKRTLSRDTGPALVATDKRHFQTATRSLDGQTPVVTGAAAVSVRNDGNTVDVDAEMAKLAETQITFSAIVQLTSGKLATIRSAIFEGRR